MNKGELKEILKDSSLDDFGEVRVYCRQCYEIDFHPGGVVVDTADIVAGELVLDNPIRDGRFPQGREVRCQDKRNQ